MRILFTAVLLVVRFVLRSVAAAKTQPRSLSCALQTAMLLGALSTPGHADEYWKFIAVDCVPEIGLFQVRTFALYNVIENFPLQVEKTQKVLEPHGIHLLRDLNTQTFKCSINDHLIEAGGTYEGGRDSGPCGGNDDASLWLTIDGKLVLETDHTHGGCPDSVSHDIQVTKDSVFWCTTTYPYFPPFESGPDRKVHTECRTAAKLQ